MELRQLEYFSAVARHRHFTRAAEELYVSQPALSQQVRRLERELGLALLRRTSRGVELTPAGEDLRRRADAILAEVERARAEMDQHAGVERGLVRVGATAGDALRLPAALAQFHREHPGVRIGLRQGSQAEVVELVRSGGADVGVAGAAEVAGLEQALVGEEPLVVALAPDDPLAAAAAAAPSPLPIGELRGRGLILPEPGTPLRDAIADACAAAGFSPIPLFEVSDPWTVRSLTAAGLGASVVPRAWAALPGPPIAVRVLAEPAPRHRVALLARSADRSPAAALLHAHLTLALAGSDDGG